MKALPLDQAFDFLGIQLDFEKTAGKTLTINFDVDDTREKRSLVLRNRVLNHFAKPSASPDLTVKGTSAAIVAALMGGKPAESIARGSIKAEGRAAALTELVGMTTSPEFWFPIVTRPSWKG